MQRGQRLVLHFDQFDCLSGNLRGFGRHDGDHVAVHAHLVVREDILVRNDLADRF